MLCYTNSTSIVISTSGKLLKVFRINVFCILFYFTMMFFSRFGQERLENHAFRINPVFILFYFVTMICNFSQDLNKYIYMNTNFI